jgi:hypothetical protein
MPTLPPLLSFALIVEALRYCEHALGSFYRLFPIHDRPVASTVRERNDSQWRFA